jgi:hypothetical protein
VYQKTWIFKKKKAKFKKYRQTRPVSADSVSVVHCGPKKLGKLNK